MRELERFPQDQFYHRPYWTEPSIKSSNKQSFKQSGWQRQAVQQVLADYFKDDEGEVDMEKVLNTVGHVVRTTREIRPMVKNMQDFVRKIKS
ncbi:YppG family protein [Allobacillus sp. GCM10007489]|uniref:YppG family protein n=1 Tax=unclassified Allobacillus TaxID=2628859 RepID=UPI00164317B9|nr:YppG family protein [Allobacillus sp. SKP2-8]